MPIIRCRSSGPRYAESLRRLEMVRRDQTEPASRDVHHWQQRNPVVLEGLVQLMLGGPNHVYHGGLLHCRLFYFDPQRLGQVCRRTLRRWWTRSRPTSVSVQLVNLHPSEPRDVILQAGAFGEHEFTTAGHKHQTVQVGRNRVQVRLRPGAVGRLDLGMKRYVHAPSY